MRTTASFSGLRFILNRKMKRIKSNPCEMRMYHRPLTVFSIEVYFLDPNRYLFNASSWLFYRLKALDNSIVPEFSLEADYQSSDVYSFVVSSITLIRME